MTPSSSVEQTIYTTAACCIVTCGPHEALIDAADVGLLGNYTWRVFPRAGNHAYVARFARRRIFLHRVLTDCPPDRIVDHKDGNGLDNRRSNIRVCTRGENTRNRAKKTLGVTGLKGVSKHRDKFVALITVNGKRTYLGIYSTREAAHAAYCWAAIELHGQFAHFG